MQNRWVAYIFRYRDAVRCENAGYVKIVRTSRGNIDQAKIQIGIKLNKPVVTRCKIYIIYQGEKLRYLDEVLVKEAEKDVISINRVMDWNDFVGQGMLFEVDDGDRLMCLWENIEVPINQLSVEKKPEDSIDKPIDLIPIPDYMKRVEEETVTEDLATENASEEETEDSVEIMFNTYQKLPIFIDSHFDKCIKMIPQDIGKLPIGNWKLGQNSFLIHSYYRYKYIMLGKLKDNRDKCVIGVPGVYTNKEKYMANMFGFTLFIPVEKTDLKTGKFGYWIWEVTKT